MQHSYSSEASGFTAIQEIPCMLWNPTMQYHVPNSPPLLVLSQINPFHVPSLNEDSV
jgi:hypothetical protein